MTRRARHLQKFSTKFSIIIVDLYWAEGNLPLLAGFPWLSEAQCCNDGSVTASSRPVQAHAATFALIPYCNIPDPPTGEEDATMSLTIWATRPMNMYIHKNRNKML